MTGTQLHRDAIAVADGNPSTTTPWSFATNWTVSRGSLDTSVTLESPDFPIDADSTSPKSPLLLVPPPSSDYEPCEIKISFTQKHEIRQVYVKSSARVYEIYYSPTLHSDNEYLCTVRCSVASVEENLYHATNVEEASSVILEVPNGAPAMGKLAGGNNIGTNEDDWVEVKRPAGALDGQNNSSPKQLSSNRRSYQDFYEATAEINDSDPCMSITLRLLSLQSKDCVFIDEIYIFADSIDPSDSENQANPSEHSNGGSTLMTMLVPTLLQLTKSKASHLQDQNTSKSTEKQERLETESISSSSTNSADLPNGKLMKPSEAKDEISKSVAKNDFSYEKVIEQLVSRVSRIEELCLRFEENMLKPINSIEARLQRVEEQVDLLAKNTQFSGASESKNEKTGVNETYKPPEETSVSVKIPQYLPSLVVTAPDFSCCDEEEVVNNVSELPENASKKIPKKVFSIDDALAAALAGFSSVTTISKSSEECSKEEASKSSETEASEECSKEEASKSSETEGDENGNYEHVKTITPESSEVGVLECLEDSNITSSDDESIGISEVVNEEAISQSIHENDTIKENFTRKVNILKFDKAEILKHFSANETPNELSTRDDINDGSESIIDFETPILEVKFSSFESGMKSPLEALLSVRTTDEDVVSNQETEICSVKENETTTLKNLLVELDGELGDGEQDNLMPVNMETFASVEFRLRE